MTIGELILLNPSSHENIDKILSGLKNNPKNCGWM